MANGMFGDYGSTLNLVQRERMNDIRSVQDPFERAGAFVGGMFGGAESDPRVQKARALEEARKAVEAKGLDLMNKPGEFLGSLAQELNQRGLTGEAMHVLEQYQKVQSRQAQTESAQARQKLAETRGGIAEAKEGREAAMFPGQLAKSQADAQLAQTKAQYAGPMAEASMQAKLASIQTSRMNANTALMNAQTSQERAAQERVLKGLTMEKRKLEIDQLKKNMSASGMSSKEVRAGVTDLSKQAAKAGIPETQAALDKIRKLGTGGVGYLQNIRNFPAFLKSQRGQAFSQTYQSIVNKDIKADSGAAVSATELERKQLELGVHVSQGPEAVLRGIKMIQEKTDARWQNLLRGYSEPVKEQFEQNYAQPSAPVQQEAAGSNDPLGIR
jgi:hypothetical protein